MAQEVTVYVDNLPPGTVVMWYGDGNQIPSGWSLCDGSNNTPDLCDKFIVGAGKKYPWKNTGGAETVALSLNQMPQHNHSDKTYQVIGMDAKVAGFPKVTAHADWDWENLIVPTNKDITLKTALPSNGSGEPHTNLPPYYALYYIMKVV